MKLLVDIGNTRVKWGFDLNGIMIEKGGFPHQSIHLNQLLHQQWKDIQPPELLAISSVGSHKLAEKIVQFSKQKWPAIQLFFARSSAQSTAVKNAYSDPNKLGVDRWLGLIALRHYYPEYHCVVDCGTAITVDFLGINGEHQGGIISPGIQLMKQALYQGTERLDLANNDPILGLASSTDAAINTGTVYAAAGLIEKVISELYPCDGLVITGGDAELIANNLSVNVVIEPDFVLKGLAILTNEVSE